MMKICLVFLFIEVLVVTDALGSATDTLKFVNDARTKLKFANKSDIIFYV